MLVPYTADNPPEFYQNLTREESRSGTSEVYIPKNSGKAFHVDKGQILRVTCSEGPQVGDFNAFNAHDASEFFWSGRTRTIEGAHLTTGRKLWSTEPRMRPMFTIIADTVRHDPLPHNAASHDLIFARCSDRLRELMLGHSGAPSCNTNLKQALVEIGFSPDYVHDAFNIFMTTGIDDDHRLFFLDPVAQRGDYIELYAEIDTVVAISCCPSPCNGQENKGLTCNIYST